MESNTGGTKSKRKVIVETIRSYKLKEDQIAGKYREMLEKEMQDRVNEQDWGNVENQWEKLKLSILKVARKVCGITRLNSSKKQTSWWNDQIKKQIRSKKERWKIYLGNKTEENYNKYKEERKLVKAQVLAAKSDAWKDFGNKMEDISKGN